MNEDIIRMAKQAGGRESGNPELYDCFIMSLDDLKRFAALVIANNPPQTFMSYREGYAAGVAAEREACAKVCDARYMGDNNREDMEARRCAAAIRARGITQDQPLPEDQNPSF